MNSITTTTTTTTTIGSLDPSTANPGYSVRSHRDSVGAIPNALASEWTKLRSLRSNRAILMGTAAIGIVLAWVLAVFVKTDPDTLEAFTIGNTFSFPVWLSTVLAVVTGTLMFTSEVQHGTLAAVITAQPARWVTVVAKSAIAAGFGLAMGVAGVIPVEVHVHVLFERHLVVPIQLGEVPVDEALHRQLARGDTQ